MARTPLSRKQWRALDRIRQCTRNTPLFPPQPYPWGFHQGTWTSLCRRKLVEYIFRSNVCHVRLTPNGQLALNQYEPTR